MASTPKAPDPYATAQAQSQFNTNTAVSQQLLNMVNQVNPYGSVTYDQTGTQSFVGADGKTYTLPSFTQTTSYTPEGQAILDQTMGAQQNLATTANNQSAAVQESLSNPFQFDNQAAADWAYDLGSSRLDPRFAQEEASLRTRLTNQGIREGSQAWNNAMSQLSQGKNDAYNQLMLQGRSQAYNEALTTRNQPLNELNALLSGSQLTNPGTASSATPQTSVGGVDYSGLVQSNYQSQLANSGSALGGLFGLAGTIGAGAIKAGAFSDERLKTDISLVGKLDNGLNVYAYRYKSGGPMQIGLMAQEVEKVNPSAVFEHENGFKMVDYAEAVR